MKRTIICCLTFTVLCCGEVQAQVSASNPAEWTALAEGNSLINKQIGKQMGGQLRDCRVAEYHRRLSSTRYANGRTSTTAI
jgi:hypothetical protein